MQCCTPPVVTMQVLLYPSGVPVTSGCGAPVAITPEGLPLIGPGGLPCCLGPDGDTLLTWDGKALLGPQVSFFPGKGPGCSCQGLFGIRRGRRAHQVATHTFERCLASQCSLPQAISVTKVVVGPSPSKHEAVWSRRRHTAHLGRRGPAGTSGVLDSRELISKLCSRYRQCCLFVPNICWRRRTVG
jgi:hypothetical protein